jgi:pimeloyl-ACP methyl ester carboxylesterase
MAVTYSELPNKLVKAANGVDYAYRDAGLGTVPLILLQHFRGNLHNWDPALIDALAATRRVVTLDNAGVGGSTGTTPDTIGQMARDALALLAAMRFGQADVLGFSIGSFVAQDIALIRPGVLRRLILASSAPQGAAGMHGWAADVIDAVGVPEIDPQRVLDVFNTGRRRAGTLASRHFSGCTPGRRTGTSRRPGPPGRPSTTRSAPGDPRSCTAAAAVRHQPAGVRGQRRQRPDDPAALLLPARRLDPAGAPNPRIAGQLVVTLDTVKRHVSHLLGKLGAANRTEAVTRARQLGLIP